MEHRVREQRGEGCCLIMLGRDPQQMDFVIQKATELGVDCVVPVTTTRGVVRPAAKARRRRHARFLKIARETCRQCGRAHLPEVAESVTLSDALQSHADGVGFVLWESSEGVGLTAALENATGSGDRVLLIGPEGGLTTDEVDLAREHGFADVSLGKLILRADTAVVVAVTLTASQLGRLGCPSSGQGCRRVTPLLRRGGSFLAYLPRFPVAG